MYQSILGSCFVYANSICYWFILESDLLVLLMFCVEILPELDAYSYI